MVTLALLALNSPPSSAFWEKGQASATGAPAADVATHQPIVQPDLDSNTAFLDAKEKLIALKKLLADDLITKEVYGQSARDILQKISAKPVPSIHQAGEGVVREITGEKMPTPKTKIQ